MEKLEDYEIEILVSLIEFAIEEIGHPLIEESDEEKEEKEMLENIKRKLNKMY